MLSTCETGTGKVLNGEGVLGLQRALRSSGARILITSLWALKDDATRRWMIAFYAASVDRGLDTVGAVREANLTESSGAMILLLAPPPCDDETYQAHPDENHAGWLGYLRAYIVWPPGVVRYEAILSPIFGFQVIQCEVGHPCTA